MHLHTLLAILAPALVTAIPAGCYKDPTDTGWGGDGYKDAASRFIDQICNSGGVSGYFNQGDYKYRCMNAWAGGKYEFWVGWRGHGGLTLNDNDCKQRLKNELFGCGNGGESTVADWYFRSDPNLGYC